MRLRFICNDLSRIISSTYRHDLEINLNFLPSIRLSGFIAIVIFGLSACANTPHTSVIQPLDKSAVVPYEKLLVLGLFNRYQVRELGERKLVQDINKSGTVAVAATSLMTTTMPLNATTISAVIAESGADAVLVIQLLNADDEKIKVKSRDPKTSYKVNPLGYYSNFYYPGGYYNVWEVSIQEYMEPKYLERKMKLTLMTELFIPKTRERVWAIESKANIVRDLSRPNYHPFMNAEAAQIVKYLQADDIILKVASTR